MALCYQCGMACGADTEYHPYAACLMFKQTGNARAVKSNLAAVLEQGGKLGLARIRRELLEAIGEADARSRRSLSDFHGSLSAEAMRVLRENIETAVDKIVPEEG